MMSHIETWRQQAYDKSTARIGGLLFCLFCSVMLGVSQGALYINVTAELSALEEAVLWQIRAPRVLMTMVTGAGLAMCGAILQSLTRNPLADPGILGVSSFAALFAAVAIFISSQIVLPNNVDALFIPAMALIGAITALTLLLWVAGYQLRVNTLVLILTGIALNAGAQTLLGLVIYLADDDTLRLITFWQMGSYSGINWHQAIAVGGCVCTAFAYFIRNAKPIMVMQMGEQHAKFQGINVVSVKGISLVCVALVTALCVCFTGIVGFVGLVVPHITRMLVGANLTVLLPSSVILGAVLVTLADTLARLLISPAELPIGLLTSALGVPFFLWLIIIEKRKLSFD